MTKKNNYLEIVQKLVDNTYEPASKDGTFSLKPSMRGNVLTIKFKTIVHFAGEMPLSGQTEQHKEHANQLFNACIKKLKKDFKDLCSDNLQIKPTTSGDGFEMIHSTAHSLRKVAYYRAFQNYEVL